MRFSTGLFDYLFGEKVTVEAPGDGGQIIRRKVTRRWLNKMEQEGKARKVEDQVVRVHHLATHGYEVEHWVVGRDVSIADVKRFRDHVTQEMYAMSMFEDGEPKMYFLTKEKWQLAKAHLQEQGLL